MTIEFKHEPVLLAELLSHMAWDSPDISVADFTVGGGGHLSALLERHPKPRRVLAADQDRVALEAAQRRLKAFEPIEWVHQNFRTALEASPGPWDRILVDLGVSSHQLDNADRGFSFQKEGPLDMRMDTSSGEPASDWLMRCNEEDLARVIWEFGEERRSRVIARKIVEARRKKPFQTVRDLVEGLGFQLDSKDHRGKHPLTRVFQALRIHVNDEMGALNDLLASLPALLTPKGRIGILTFHSLEDREVKWQLRGKLSQVHKKALQASDEEQKRNPRSRSAKLRVFERLEAEPKDDRTFHSRRRDSL